MSLVRKRFNNTVNIICWGGYQTALTNIASKNNIICRCGFAHRIKKCCKPPYKICEENIQIAPKSENHPIKNRLILSTSSSIRHINFFFSWYIEMGNYLSCGRMSCKSFNWLMKLLSLHPFFDFKLINLNTTS